jgi:hypothetical protein
MSMQVQIQGIPWDVIRGISAPTDGHRLVVLTVDGALVFHGRLQAIAGQAQVSGESAMSLAAVTPPEAEQTAPVEPANPPGTN